MENKSRDDESTSVVARRNDKWVNTSNWAWGPRSAFQSAPEIFFASKCKLHLTNWSRLLISKHMIREKTKSLVHSKCQSVPLKRVAKLFAGHPFRGRIEHDPEGTISVVQLKNVDPVLGVNEKRLPKVVPTGRRRPTFLEQGDILFVNRGMRFFGALVDKPLEKAVAAPHFFIIKANPALVRPDYLAWFLNSKQAQRYYGQCAAGTALPHITRKTLEALPVPVPSLERQALIAKAYQCALREKILTERIVEQRELLLSEILDAASQEQN